MFNTQEKKERALGTKLFLKAYRCNSTKCVMMRRAYRPGVHGKSRHISTEFGQQLNEKQKIKAAYGLREAQLVKLVATAAKNPGVTNELIVKFLERRLDNVVYRLGFTPSRSVARQMVNHGHILVNNRKVSAPSFLVKPDDIISIRPQSREAGPLKDLNERLKGYEAPLWLFIDKEKLEGRVVSLPHDTETFFDINKVVDYYSK